MLLYRTTKGFLLKSDGHYFTVHGTDFDELLNLPNLYNHLLEISRRGLAGQAPAPGDILWPGGPHESRAARVCYETSQGGRHGESKKNAAPAFVHQKDN